MSEISRQKIDIVFNGETVVVAQDITVMDLLHIFEVVTRRFAVVINDQIVPKSAYMTTQLEPGDNCDIISPISGG
jgi:sulfur carrier protein